MDGVMVYQPSTSKTTPEPTPVVPEPEVPDPEVPDPGYIGFWFSTRTRIFLCETFEENELNINVGSKNLNPLKIPSFFKDKAVTYTKKEATVKGDKKISILNKHPS